MVGKMKIICKMKDCNNEVVPGYLMCGKCEDLLQEAQEMKSEEVQMKFEDFKEMIEEFVTENFEVVNCRECHETANSEIVPIESIHKKKGKVTDYDKAVKKLYNNYMNRLK